MKHKLLFLLFLFCGFLINGQEIKLNSAVLTSAGGSHELSNVNIAKWRLGEVHLIVLQSDVFSEELVDAWNVNSYPNPFNDLLNLDFQTKEMSEFTIQVTDIMGKRLLYKEEKTIMPNQLIQLDLHFLTSALYLVRVIPKDNSIQRVFKVQKQ